MADHPSTRLLLHSRAVTFVAVIIEVALVNPKLLTDAWVWLGVAIGVALGHVAILAWLRTLAARGAIPHATSRGPAFRRALVWLPTVTLALTMPLALAIGLAELSIDALVVTALASAVFGVVPAALGYAAIERSLPEPWREPELRRWVWRPSSRGMLAGLIAWPLVSWALFWILTGVTANDGCIVDARCSVGVPFRFASFGGRGEGSHARMDWIAFAQNLGLIASLAPAAYLFTTSRARRVFAGYLVLVCLGLALMVVDKWSGTAGVRIWQQVTLLEIGR